MKNIIENIKDNPLFNNIEQSDIPALLGCLSSVNKSYSKGEIVFNTGDEINSIGLILSGAVRVIQDDENGDRSIIAEIPFGQLFAEALVCSGVKFYPVTVEAVEKTEILYLNYKKLITTCNNSCVFHSKLVENMLRLLAIRNITLNQKIDILSKRTTQEKILCYLKYESKGANKFTIPFNREALANYLCVDRSAMSNELSKMQKEGLISFNKNLFKLKV